MYICVYIYIFIYYYMIVIIIIIVISKVGAAAVRLGPLAPVAERAVLRKGG